MSRIFISYSSHDSAHADAYYQVLTDRQHEVWMDRAELKGGQEWVHIIQEKIRWADVMVVLWSKGALASTWVEMEMTYAHTLKKRIIPVRIDDTSPQEHMIINARQVIDGRRTEDEDVVTYIEDAVGRDNPRPITTAIPSVMPPPDEPPALAVVKTGLNTRWLLAGAVGAVVILVAVLVILRPNPSLPLTPTPEPTLSTPVTSSAPLPTLSPGAFDQPATLDLLNAWRASGGLVPLTVNAALQTVADDHISYLRSLPLPELESTNVFRNAEGQDIVFMADEAGYSGDVTMVVETTDGQFTLQNLLDQMDDQARFVDAGFQQVRSIATDKLYFVLILGAGSG